MQYCPSCGEKALITNKLPVTQFVCEKCDFTLFHNTAAAVMVAICHQDEVLVAVRAREPGLGMWDLPGGFADPDESLEQAVIRELEEELSFTVENPRYVMSNPNTYLYKGIEYKTLDAFFVVELASKPDLIAADDVASVEWVKQSDLELDKFAFESTKKALAQLFSL